MSTNRTRSLCGAAFASLSCLLLSKTALAVSALSKPCTNNAHTTQRHGEGEGRWGAERDRAEGGGGQSPSSEGRSLFFFNRVLCDLDSDGSRTGTATTTSIPYTPLFPARYRHTPPAPPRAAAARASRPWHRPGRAPQWPRMQLASGSSSPAATPPGPCPPLRAAPAGSLVPTGTALPSHVASQSASASRSSSASTSATACHGRRHQKLIEKGATRKRRSHVKPRICSPVVRDTQ